MEGFYEMWRAGEVLDMDASRGDGFGWLIGDRPYFGNWRGVGTKAGVGLTTMNIVE